MDETDEQVPTSEDRQDLLSFTKPKPFNSLQEPQGLWISYLAPTAWPRRSRSALAAAPGRRRGSQRSIVDRKHACRNKSGVPATASRKAHWAGNRNRLALPHHAPPPATLSNTSARRATTSGATINPPTPARMLSVISRPPRPFKTNISEPTRSTSDASSTGPVSDFIWVKPAHLERKSAISVSARERPRYYGAFWIAKCNWAD